MIGLGTGSHRRLARRGADDRAGRRGRAGAGDPAGGGGLRAGQPRRARPSEGGGDPRRRPGAAADHGPALGRDLLRAVEPVPGRHLQPVQPGVLRGGPGPADARVGSSSSGSRATRSTPRWCAPPTPPSARSSAAVESWRTLAERPAAGGEPRSRWSTTGSGCAAGRPRSPTGAPWRRPGGSTGAEGFYAGFLGRPRARPGAGPGTGEREASSEHRRPPGDRVRLRPQPGALRPLRHRRPDRSGPGSGSVPAGVPGRAERRGSGGASRTPGSPGGRSSASCRARAAARRAGPGRRTCGAAGTT